MPRLIRLGQYRLEAYLDGVLCIFTHQDVPGMIGKVGSAFGSHNVNIAQMSVGREGIHAGRHGHRRAESRRDSAPGRHRRRAEDPVHPVGTSGATAARRTAAGLAAGCWSENDDSISDRPQ